MQISPLGKPDLLVGNYYFLPRSDAQAFNDTLRFISREIDFSKDDVLILGDYNFPGTDWNSSTINAASPDAHARAREMIEFVSLNVLYQLDTTTNGAGNVLDLRMTNILPITLGAVLNPFVAVDKWHPPFILCSDVSKWSVFAIQLHPWRLF